MVKSSSNIGTRASWQELEPWIDRLLDLAPEARHAAARKLCGHDPELLTELISLLDAVLPSESMLADSVSDALPDLVLDLAPPALLPASGQIPTQPAPDRTGEILGVYRIEHLLGRGGMSNVYLARRSDGAFERKVAIKIARERQSSPAARARFQSEQQILADLDHPHIARLVDAGLTQDALPYAVVEYVEGLTLDVYCHEQKLSVEQRLGLFLDICQAVDHAHRRLVIHRDLKPNNILVDTRGTVKLLDFGIAELLDSQAPAADGGTLLLTPEYAAPEQFMRGRLSTATDVFALGAILFELLTDRRLRDLQDSSPPVWIEQVLRDQAPKASALTPPLPASQARRLRGDLDAIIMKALAPDPDRRYPSSRALADDIQHHLASRPISAREGARLYAAGRFLRRQWPMITVGLAVIALILGAAGTAIHESRQAERERLQALESQSRAEQVSSFLVKLFDDWDPYQFRDGEVSAKDLLDLGTERARSQLTETPGIRAELLHTLANVHLRLGLYDDSEKILHTLHGFDDQLSPIERARRLNLLSQLHFTRGEASEAISSIEAAFEILDIDPFEDSLESLDLQHTELLCSLLNRLGNSYEDIGQDADAERTLRRALRIAETLGSARWQSEALANLASTVTEGSEGYDEELLRRAIQIHRDHQIDDPQNMAAMLNNLSLHLMDSGRWQQAMGVQQELQEVSRQVLGPHHPELANHLINMARLRIDLGSFELALQHLEEAKTIHQQAGIDSGPYAIALSMNLGRALAELRRPEAVDLLQSTRQQAVDELGAEHPWIPMIIVRLAEASLRLGRAQDALLHAESCLEDLAPGNARRLDARLTQGASLARLDRCAEAEPILLPVSSKMAATHPAGSWRLAWAQLELAECRERLGRGSLPDDRKAEILRALRATRGPEDPLTRRAQALTSRAASRRIP